MHRVLFDEHTIAERDHAFIHISITGLRDSHAEDCLDYSGTGYR